jgi:hypothetical protein
VRTLYCSLGGGDRSQSSTGFRFTGLMVSQQQPHLIWRTRASAQLALRFAQQWGWAMQPQISMSAADSMIWCLHSAQFRCIWRDVMATIVCDDGHWDLYRYRVKAQLYLVWALFKRVGGLGVFNQNHSDDPCL